MKFKNTRVQKVYETICTSSLALALIVGLLTSDNMSTGEFLFVMVCLIVTMTTGYIIGKASR